MAIDWNDPSQPGNHVTTINGESIDVGAATANFLNAADNVARPAEPGVDVTSPAQFKSWRGRCGLFNGQYNSGTFGQGPYATADGTLSHTYPSSTTGQVRICAVAYFVHGKNTSNPPSSATEITAGGTKHNVANSVESASGTPLANSCVNVVFVSNPQLTTNAGPDVQVGTAIHDTAALTGASANVTGTITFRLYGPNNATCSGPPIFTSTKPVNGNGTYVSDNFTPTSAGTYRWIANYAGDANNNATTNSCNAANENVTVGKLQPALTTDAGNPVTLGSSIHDAATLSGATNSATGTITFDLYGPNDAACAVPIFTTTKAVIANGTYLSADFTPTAAGTYRWVANYSGDASNNATSNGCNGANENVLVGRSGPTVTTDAGPDVSLGATLQDSATLAGGTNPTGKITFDLYGPNDGTCATTIFHTETTVNGNGTYQSTGFMPTTPGTYRWIANYSGDANNNATSNACNGANENVVVSANPAIDIVKTGPASALAGADVSFTLDVSNPGDQRLSNVSVTDPRCDAVPPALVSKHGDASPATFDPGDVWTYTCTAHTTAGATNLHNVGNVCGQPPSGAQVCDDSPTDVPLRNPDISIDKTGPASVTAGDTINYTLDVTNTGDQRFAESQVVLTDPNCDATPTLNSKNGDATPSFLNPGDTWSYSCSHVTQSTDTGSYHNLGTVDATDETGDLVSNADDADTVIVGGVEP